MRRFLLILTLVLAAAGSPRVVAPSDAQGVSAGHPAATQHAHAPTQNLGKPESAKDAPATLPFRVQPDDVLTRRGFEKFYNMDYDGAIELFREERKARPGDPFVVN